MSKAPLPSTGNIIQEAISDHQDIAIIYDEKMVRPVAAYLFVFFSLSNHYECFYLLMRYYKNLK